MFDYIFTQFRITGERNRRFIQRFIEVLMLFVLPVYIIVGSVVMLFSGNFRLVLIVLLTFAATLQYTILSITYEDKKSEEKQILHD